MPGDAPTVEGGAANAQGPRPGASGPGTESGAAQLTRRIVQAAQDPDPAGIQGQLDRAASSFGPAWCVDEILIPATRQLRRMVATGRRDIVQELMATESIRAWLSHRCSFAPPPQEIGPILVACGPRDPDLVGPEALALLLRLRRWPCRVLGARTSTFHLTIAAQASDATAVVVFSTERRGRSPAILSLRAVDERLFPVFFAGRAFHSQRRRRHLPGRFLGPNLQQATDLLIGILAPMEPGRSALLVAPAR